MFTSITAYFLVKYDLLIAAFHVPGFTDSGFSCSWFYRFRLFMFLVLQIPAFHVPGFLVPFPDSPFLVLQIAMSELCRGNYVNLSEIFVWCRKIANNGRAKEIFAPLWRTRSEICNALVNAITLDVFRSKRDSL